MNKKEDFLKARKDIYVKFVVLIVYKLVAYLYVK